MNSGTVRQLGALSQLFGDALRSCRPESVAVLGVAGGNGLEQIDPAVTGRVCGFDINPEYLRAVRRRFSGLPGLELHCADLAEECGPPAAMQLVHAALIFEHAGTGPCLENAVNMVAPGGWLSVVLQLPSATEAAVWESSPTSIQALRREFRPIDPAAFTQQLEGMGFGFLRSQHCPLPSGKAFWMGLFERLPL